MTKFLVRDKKAFSDQVISELIKAKIIARKVFAKDRISGEIAEIQFLISLFFNFTDYVSVVKLLVEGEKLELTDCQRIVDVITKVLGVKSTLDLKSGRKITYLWSGSKY